GRRRPLPGRSSASSTSRGAPKRSGVQRRSSRATRRGRRPVPESIHSRSPYPAAGVSSMDTRALRDFIRLGRYPFLLSGFIPFTAGALLAFLLGARFTPAQFLVGYAAMAAAHLSVNYSNDYFDADADRFVETTPISGGSGVLAANPGLKPAALRVAVALMAVSVLIGYFFVTVYAYPIVFLVFGIAGNLLGWFYTAPPIALAYRNLGEVTNMITFGLLMPGAGYFVAAGTLDAAFFVF